MFVSERGTSTSWADRQEEKEWSGSQQTADEILSIKGGCRDGIGTRDLNCRAAEMEANLENIALCTRILIGNQKVIVDGREADTKILLNLL